MIQHLIAFVLLFGMVVAAPAQRRRARRSSSPVRISKENPTIYITFVRQGKIADVRTGEVKEHVWLRMHNNTRWAINIQASGAPKEYGDTSLYYGIETEPRDEVYISVD